VEQHYSEGASYLLWSSAARNHANIMVLGSCEQNAQHGQEKEKYCISETTIVDNIACNTMNETN